MIMNPIVLSLAAQEVVIYKVYNLIIAEMRPIAPYILQIFHFYTMSIGNENAPSSRWYSATTVIIYLIVKKNILSFVDAK